MTHPLPSTLVDTPNFRAVLAELLAAINSYHLFTDVETTTAAQRAERMHQATRAAAEALAAPEAKTGSYQPTPITPEDIDDRLRRAFRQCIDEGIIPRVDNRNPECVQLWPDCCNGGYDPRCCRFPKSCSCGP